MINQCIECKRGVDVALISHITEVVGSEFRYCLCKRCRLEADRAKRKRLLMKEIEEYNKHALKGIKEMKNKSIGETLRSLNNRLGEEQRILNILNVKVKYSHTKIARIQREVERAEKVQEVTSKVEDDHTLQIAD